jgi:putative PIN family toxin of toxin-antitoxin system
MGQKGLRPVRAVCDTNVVVSALVFADGRLGQIRAAWHSGALVALISKSTVEELIRVLSYPKFRLTLEEQSELLEDYLPYAETAEISNVSFDQVKCRDPDDQKFLDLAVSARADWLITGDSDLLALSEQTDVLILQPARALARLGR